MKKKRLAQILAIVVSISIIGCAADYTTVFAASDKDSTTIDNLCTNYQENPIGIDTDGISFGWQMDSNVIGESQASYQIKVEDTDGNQVWDSGVVVNTTSTAISYKGSELSLETGYYWMVTVTDTYGNTYESEKAYFETGCDWSGAEWITTQGWAESDVTTTIQKDEYNPNAVEYTIGEVDTNGADAPLFRTEQALTGSEVKTARLYMTSLGSYEAYINGKEVQGDTNSILAPGWTDYTDHVNYQTYDVTNYISGDTVTLGAIVGAGWYGSSMNSTSGYGNVYGQDYCNERCLYAKLVITYADGTEQEIVTDDKNWKTSDTLSPYETTGIYEGEVYNGSKALLINGWDQNGFDTSNGSDWKTAVCMGDYSGEVEPNNLSIGYDFITLPYENAYTYNADTDIKTAEEGSEYTNGEIDSSKAVYYESGDSITLKEGDTLVLDFGQNASGMPKLTVSGNEGTDVYMQPGEVLSDGKESTGNPDEDGSSLAKGEVYPGAASSRSFHYILSGDGIETYRAQMHFCGYQYLRITATGGDITIYSADSIAVSSLTDVTGTVETSNNTLNKFMNNTKWSQLSNFLSIPTDCPTREYRGWEGDAQLFAETAMYNFDSAEFLSNYEEIMNDYFDQNGTYSCLAPGSSDYAYNTDRVAAWSDAGIIIPYAYYQQTGDITLAAEYWNELSTFVDTIYEDTTFAEGSDFSSGYKGGFQWGDHMAVKSASTTFMNLTFTLYDNILMMKMATALGNEEAVEKYSERVDYVREFMINRYVDEDGNVNCATADPDSTPMIGGTVVDNAQTALSWALKLELYNTEEQKEGMSANLAASVQNENGSIRSDSAEDTLAVGFPGVNVLMPSLSESGQSSTAFDLMLNTALYTPLYSTAHGATTTWESWDGWTEEDGYDGNSKNHFSYGAPAEWVYEYLVGIQKDEENPGFKHFILQPEVDDSLDYANGSYDSYYGAIESDWTATDGVLDTYYAQVPSNTTATLYLPISEDKVDNTEVTEGVTYVGMTTHNGLTTAQFELQSGGYNFAVKNGKLTISIADGYTKM